MSSATIFRLTYAIRVVVIIAPQLATACFIYNENISTVIRSWPTPLPLFDFAIIPQVVNTMLCWQQLWSDVNVEHEAALIFEHIFIQNDNISHIRASKCGNKISSADFYIAFYINYRAYLA